MNITEMEDIDGWVMTFNINEMTFDFIKPDADDLEGHTRWWEESWPELYEWLRNGTEQVHIEPDHKEVWWKPKELCR